MRQLGGNADDQRLEVPLGQYRAVNVVQVVYMTHEGLEACVEEHPDFEVRRA